MERWGKKGVEAVDERSMPGEVGSMGSGALHKRLIEAGRRVSGSRSPGKATLRDRLGEVRDERRHRRGSEESYWQGALRRIGPGGRVPLWGPLRHSWGHFGSDADQYQRCSGTKKG